MNRNGSPANNNLLVFAHIGDLHITKAKEQNYKDFLSIVSQIETECGDALDFVFLPGDNADNGQPQQYNLVSTALKMLSTPVHIIAGDHDMEHGSLTSFYKMPLSEILPKSLSVNGFRCIFLDVCGFGTGGPDFKIGDEQFLWLENELVKAKDSVEKIVLFMHTYPDDLKDKTETIKLNKLIANNEVVFVAMGHTHYNELANDGKTIFGATRSTGQIEEGPVGFSFITIDNGIVSWRFKPLENPFPFVVITNPSDYRLSTTSSRSVGGLEVRAVVFGKEIKKVFCKVDDGVGQEMQQTDNGRIWSVCFENQSAKINTITVEAVDGTGRPGLHSIQPTSPFYTTKTQYKNGSDADSIGAWPENGIFGTQLGPNRNGKPS